MPPVQTPKIKEYEMKNSGIHYNIVDVCQHYGLSESTIRRKVREAREGISTFPLPLFGKGNRVMWRKDDIVNWEGEGNLPYEDDDSTPS